MRAQGTLASLGDLKDKKEERCSTECAQGDALPTKPSVRIAPCVGFIAAGSDVNAGGIGPAVRELVNEGNAALMAGRLDDAEKLFKRRA